MGIPSLLICCGPRCGSFPGHRGLYNAIERCVSGPVRPTLCQGLCAGGITVVSPQGIKRKIASLAEAKSLEKISFEDSQELCQP